MPLLRKIRKIGNSTAFPVPNEVFDFLNFDPKKVKYKLSQDETGSVYILVLDPDVVSLEEKKFQKLGSVYGLILPKPLCNLWRIGFRENETKELEISFSNSPRKWLLTPVR